MVIDIEHEIEPINLNDLKELQFMLAQVDAEEEDTALALWKEWFEYSGNPWQPDIDGWSDYCFFCGEENPEHKWNCIFVRACRIVIPQDK